MTEHIFIQTLIEENLVMIGLIVAVPILLLYAYKRIRAIPTQPDYIKIFHNQQIADERLNRTEKRYGWKFLYRGHSLLGKIITVSDTKYKTPKKGDYEGVGKREWQQQPKETVNIISITFRRLVFNLGFYKIFHWHRDILKFTEKDHYAIEEGGKLVFPSDVSFTALGECYATVNSYEKLSRVILDNFSTRLLMANTNLMAGEMAKISSISPQMAHELNIKRLEIDKIKAEKMMKMGNII